MRRLLRMLKHYSPNKGEENKPTCKDVVKTLKQIRLEREKEIDFSTIIPKGASIT
jgi:hypothetical protein